MIDEFSGPYSFLSNFYLRVKMLRPFFPFYGSKWRTASLYGDPRGSTVVEPFAGSAGFSVFWECDDVWLFDIDPVIVGVWDYLIKATKFDFANLPLLSPGQSITDFNISQEAKWLIGFWLNRGSSTPKLTLTEFSARSDKGQMVWGQKAKNRLMEQAGRIKTWRVSQSSYVNIDSCQFGQSCYWFVDPPYVEKGRYYKHRIAACDYSGLADWCKHLPGYGCVCENTGAGWLPFENLSNAKSMRGRSLESVYWIGYNPCSSTNSND